jgi:AbrB family looped-hinge helix DNA binding protein
MGQCKKQNPFRGTVTVSDKGQIVIPASLMRELNIEKGNQLIIVKRDDNLGFVAIKSEAISETLNKMVNNNPI